MVYNECKEIIYSKVTKYLKKKNRVVDLYYDSDVLEK